MWINFRGPALSWINFCGLGSYHEIHGILYTTKFNTRMVSCVTQEMCSSLVGIATDGASSNVPANGLMGLVQEKLPWFWCLAHRTELAISDALTGTSCFKMVDDMLLRLYYLYQKSPKSAEN